MSTELNWTTLWLLCAICCLIYVEVCEESRNEYLGTQACLVHKQACGLSRRYEKALKQTYSQACPKSAMRVQGAIGSRSSAIHNDYRVSLHPSLVPEPRYPSLKVVLRLAPKSFC